MSFVLVIGDMVLEQNAWFSLGVVSCSSEAKEVLDQAGIPQDELLRSHLLPSSPELRADHIHALNYNEWICSSFELKTSERTVWIITDPQQMRTNLYLEP